MPLFPALQSCQRVFFSLRASYLHQRMLAFGGLNARRLGGLLAVMRRPWRIAQALVLEQFEKRFERAGMRIDRRMSIADFLEARRHGDQGEIARLAIGHFLPGERR